MSLFDEIERAQKGQEARPTKRYVYDTPPWQAWIEVEDKPPVPLSYPTGVRMTDKSIRALSWTPERLQDALRYAIEEYGRCYGGSPILRLTKPQEPCHSHVTLSEARENRLKAEASVLDGPDGAGKRWLIKLRRGESAPVLKIVNELPGIKEIAGHEPWYTGDG